MEKRLSVTKSFSRFWLTAYLLAYTFPFYHLTETIDGERIEKVQTGFEYVYHWQGLTFVATLVLLFLALLFKKKWALYISLLLHLLVLCPLLFPSTLPVSQMELIGLAFVKNLTNLAYGFWLCLVSLIAFAYAILKKP